ncbi:alpha/beta hydrolase [Alteriqipengyuania abyssalis]|uniref:alpha/beta hydrolase n=1 Tax=Alteriqipengyuania abyssalis TaxID=2860200 RepID=UPI0020070536|nr:alpha/beta hydrolase [Alteriqipengyuania abyssalis]
MVLTRERAGFPGLFALCLLGLCALLVSTAATAGPVSSRVYEPVSLADTQVEFRGEPPQAITVQTADGLTLAGAYWPPDEGVDQIVVVFQGNSYNHLVMAVRAEPLRVGGRGVLLASYRGFGDNPGEPSEAGLYRDAEAWIAQARTLQPDARLYLFGFSLGGAVALEMAARHDVTAVATMGAFTSLKDAAPALLRPFVTEQYDNLETITRVNEPILLLHGTKDETIDPRMAERLEKAGGANVTRVNLTGGGHWVPLDSLAEKIWQQWEAAEAENPAVAGKAP